MIFQGKVGKLELLGVESWGWPYEQIYPASHSIRCIPNWISVIKCPLSFLITLLSHLERNWHIWIYLYRYFCLVSFKLLLLLLLKHLGRKNNSDKGSWNLTLLLGKTWATICYCFDHQHSRLITPSLSAALILLLKEAKTATYNSNHKTNLKKETNTKALFL